MSRSSLKICWKISISKHESQKKSLAYAETVLEHASLLPNWLASQHLLFLSQKASLPYTKGEDQFEFLRPRKTGPIARQFSFCSRHHRLLCFLRIVYLCFGASECARVEVCALCKLDFGILASPTFFHGSEHGGVVECQHHRAVSCMYWTFCSKMLTTQQENAILLVI